MKKIDKTNAFLAGVVFLVSFVVYALTVQRTFSFWDCGEFIACAYILGIPHPPGTPLFVLLGRLFSMMPFVEDIAYRINYLSVVSSSLTALFAYLLTVRMVGYFFGEDKNAAVSRFIAYVGGVAGALFVAFSETNWANSVEAEVYGLALAMILAIVWLTIRYFELRDTNRGRQLLLMVIYLGMLGIGVHMTVFLAVPIAAVFFILKKESRPVDWALMFGFIILELILIILFADTLGAKAFYVVSGILGLVLLVLLHRKISWAILIAIASLATIMHQFSLFLIVAPMGLAVLLAVGGLLSARESHPGIRTTLLGVGAVAAVVAGGVLAGATGQWTVFAIIAVLAVVATAAMGTAARIRAWSFDWKTALMILLVGLAGFSVHLFIPIRSSLNPRIDQNNASRDTRTFIDLLDRKQYGQMSMIDRMFHRRGLWENQIGRHPHMGFWSYFEEQYSSPGWGFVPFLALGLIGMYVAIRKRLEIGLPYFTLFLLGSLGLILYMNFADGTQFSEMTGDAYLEVRNRDYFFTPAFVFFGIAMGMGVSAVMQWAREKLAEISPGFQKPAVYVLSVLVLLPAVALTTNYHVNDRSANVLPLIYARNLLDTCDKDAILFTSGDNDTFPLWCLQEVYDYRKDVRVINLSLLNTDWYVEQMKNRYDVPISLTDAQILWYPFEMQPGMPGQRPKEMFHDRPRGLYTYMQMYRHPESGQIVRVADMITDDIVIENRWRHPVYFSAPPYAESPLKLRERATSVGVIYRLDRQPPEGNVDVEKSYDLFLNTYSFQGMENSEVYRDDNATGVFMALGARAVLLYDRIMKMGREDTALTLLQSVLDRYPEYWQAWGYLATYYESKGDTTRATEAVRVVHDTLTAFLESSPENLIYMQDLGMVKVDLGSRLDDSTMINDGLDLVWAGFEGNQNDGFAFQKLTTVLIKLQRYSELSRAAHMIARYKKNLENPFLRQLLAIEDAENNAPSTGGPASGPDQ